jgi:hypothetical protein
MDWAEINFLFLFSSCFADWTQLISVRILFLIRPQVNYFSLGLESGLNHFIISSLILELGPAVTTLISGNM